MKYLILLILIAAPLQVMAQKTMEAALPDGRKVLLKPDKTWEYAALKPGPAPAGQPALEELGPLAALMKKTPAAFTQIDEETPDTFLAKLINNANTAKLNTRLLKDIYFVLPVGFEYQFESMKFQAFMGLLDENYELVSRKNGIFGWDLPEITLKMDIYKARDIKPYLRLAVNGIPFRIDGTGDRVRFLPLKYIIYDDRDKKILSTIATGNDTN